MRKHFRSLTLFLLAAVAAAALSFVALLPGSQPASAQLPRVNDSTTRQWSDYREFLKTARFQRVLTVDAGGKGDYKTLAAAYAYVNSQTHDSTHKWLIEAGATEDSIGTVPDWTVVSTASGFFQGAGLSFTVDNGTGGVDIESAGDATLAGDTVQLIAGTSLSINAPMSVTTGPVDMTAVALSIQGGNTASKPATCTQKRLYLDTQVPALCACTATNTWKCSALS